MEFSRIEYYKKKLNTDFYGTFVVFFISANILDRLFFLLFSIITSFVFCLKIEQNKFNQQQPENNKNNI